MHRLVSIAVVLLAASAAPASGSGTYRDFGHPRPVSIRGYDGDAMEPFITPDGRYLLFNNLNQPGVHTTLRFARRTGRDSFTYGGQVAGANDSSALTGVPAVAAHGTMYFVSPRRYAQTRSTIYRSHLAAGRATGVALVAGLAAPRWGIVDFDVGVNAQGTDLYVSQGEFTGGPAPAGARLVLYSRRGAGFELAAAGARWLRAVNRPGSLVYAAGISADGLELFFTRVDPGATPAIYRAARADSHSPFGGVQRVAGASGFVEAPSLSADGTVLYYHRRVPGGFRIYALSRPRSAVLLPRQIVQVAGSRAPVNALSP